MRSGFNVGNLLKTCANLTLMLIISCLITACGSKVRGSFLAISDIHFTPFSTCQINQPCRIIQQLQAAPAQQWMSILQQQDTLTPSTSGTDTNTALFNSLLAEVRLLPRSYHFVLLTGDFLAHNYQRDFQQFTGDNSQQDYQQFVNKTYQFLQLQFQQVFPEVPVYIALGNNDSYDGNYYSQPNGDFYKNLTQLWQRMIPNAANKASFEQTFPQAGYYAITVPTRFKATNRIIFLNTVLFSAVATGPDITAAAQQELNWLQQQLQSAQKNKQQVWLVYHIPNGVDAYYTVNKKAITMSWQPQYNKVFFNLVNKYSQTIVGLISAHVHMDGAQIMHMKSMGRIVNTFIPAISPVYGNYPAFKIYDYNPRSMRITNFQTYYLPVSTKDWALEYDFNKVYQPFCHPCRILNGYSTIKTSGWRTEQYKKYYGVSTESQYITQGYWMPVYWCAMQHQTEKGYQACVKAAMATKKKSVGVG
ncbi:MAG: metallophosphoesterase [Gammaproteobacteria bacterium]